MALRTTKIVEKRQVSENIYIRGDKIIMIENDEKHKENEKILESKEELV